MRRLLKVILLTFLCTAAAMGLVLGGTYLFGGFNEKPIYAESISFSEAEVVKSGPFSLTVNTPTENVNKRTLVLETSKSPNGDAIINYPKYITIGEPFHIAPILTDGTPVGGYLELYARYEGEGSNQSAVATCKILIDVPVKTAELKIDATMLKLGHSIDISKANETKLADIITISPTNALMPYANSSNAITSIANGTLFAGQNVVNKKIFLKIASNDDNSPVTFRIGEGATATTSTQTELTYAYLNGQLVATNTISIITSGEIVGSVTIEAYVCSSYDSNAEVISDLDRLSVPAIKATHDISVINYTIDQMSLASDTESVFLGETTKLYLNNQNAEAGSINLGIDLVSSDGKTTDQLQSFINKSIFVKFDDSSVGGILSRSSGTQDNADVNYGLNCLSGSTQMDEWYFNLVLNNYQSYLDYVATGNKIKLTVTFYDKDGTLGETQTIIKKDFYLIPKITEVAKVESTQYSLTAKSGSELSFNKDKYSIKFANNETPVGIAKNFEIVHYVKCNTPTSGTIVINGIAIASEYTQATLNGENILILKTPNAVVTGSGTFKIYSQACYKEGQNIYFLGENCNTDVEVVEAIEYIDCYSYENDQPVNFTKFQFDENEKDGGKSVTRYLYVTTSSEQLPKLTTFVNNNKLKINFKQISGLADETKYNSSTLGGGLKDQNKNTISFGNWEAVRKDGVVVGYKISYTIGEVVTIQIDGNPIQSIFEISVYLDISPVEVTTNYKVASGNSASLQYEIKDKILRNTVLSLDSMGTSRENPISLTATVNDAGRLTWTGANLSKLTYGFAYEGNTPASISGYSYKFVFEEGNLPNSICTFTAQEGFKGGINFSTLPFKAEGYLGKFTFLCQNANSENSIMQWNEDMGRFEQVVNPSLKAKDLYFRLTGLNLVIEANSTKISGINGSNVHIFKDSNTDTNYLFTLKRIEGNTQIDVLSDDFRQFLTLEVVMGSKEDNDKVSFSLADNNFAVNSDFISNSQVKFSFSCQNSTIKIANNGEELSSISREILGAFDVSQKESTAEISLGENAENALLAPMFVGLTKDSYLEITYGGKAISTENDPFASGVYTLSFMRKTETAEWLVLSNEGTITLKAINSLDTVQTSFIVRIALKSDSSVYNDFEVKIHAKSSISKDNLVIKYAGEGATENIITAGKNNGVSYGNGISFLENSSLATLAQNSKIISITLETVYADDGIKNFIKTTNASSDLVFGFYAGDLASDQMVTVKFTFAFSDGAGVFTISKQITVHKNISLSLVTERKSATNPDGYDGFDYQSGDSIKIFNPSTYSYTQNGSVITALDLSNYADTDTKDNHPHIKDLENLTVGTAGELVLLARFKTNEDTQDIIPASFTLVYEYNNDGLEYSQDIKFEFEISLISMS